MPQISVTASGADRETPTEKISRCVELDAEAKQGSRLRIPVMMYDRSSTSYKHISNAAWTVVLEGLTAEQIEAFVQQVGEKIRDVAQTYVGLPAPAPVAETDEQL